MSSDVFAELKQLGAVGADAVMEVMEAAESGSKQPIDRKRLEEMDSLCDRAVRSLELMRRAQADLIGMFTQMRAIIQEDMSGETLEPAVPLTTAEAGPVSEAPDVFAGVAEESIDVAVDHELDQEPVQEPDAGTGSLIDDVMMSIRVDSYGVPE